MPLILFALVATVKSKSLLKNIGKYEDSRSTSDSSKSAKDDLILPDHIVGMKMERDGDENKNYHHEVFIGREKLQNADSKEILTKIFKAIDMNADLFIDEKEMMDWVLTKTREHFYEARLDNELTVETLDADNDDRISWNEFLSNLITNDADERKDILKRLVAEETVKTPEKLYHKVQHARESWIRVQDIGKTSLTYAQFFDFQHPETSSETLQYLVQDILHDMDMDNSNDLTVQEYVAMPHDADVDALNDIWTVERRKEFREVIDLNKDGIVTVKELEAYLDPLSPTMAGQEARQLIGFGDTNEDGKLTLQEILESSEYYTGSKLYNYAQSVHEEF